MMNSIKFNTATKEIEVTGSESFIESNFDMIKNLLAKSSGIMEVKGSNKTKAQEEPVLWGEMIGPQATEAIQIPEGIDIPETTQAKQQDILHGIQEPKVKRPPVRKYFNTFGKLIRSEDTSINNSPVANIVENIPRGISIASLKEKFGLSHNKIEEIIRDAEKQGKGRRDMDGSFVWV